MIELRDVYKSFSATTMPLRGVSLDVEEGTTMVVLGRSGTGKSVLLKSIVGLLVPESGSVKVDDVEVVGATREQLLQIRRKVGYVFQSGALFDSMTVAENLAFPLRKTTDMREGEIRDKVAHYLEKVGLPDKGDQMPADLSGGQRKRIGVARTIVTEPAYLLYDEPTTGLDPQTTRDIAQLIVQLKEELGITGIVVTHDPYCLQIVADRVALIEDGCVSFEGTVDEARVSNNEFLEVFFTLESA